jgi:hypothetical protein
MTRVSFILIALVSLGTVSAFGADIDGKWLSDIKIRDFDVKVTFDLKSSGNQLTGSVTTETPRGERTSEIKDGKLDGDKFSFTTLGGRDGSVKITWEGTVEGDQLKGQQTREGGSLGPMPFVAKRQ